MNTAAKRSAVSTRLTTTLAFGALLLAGCVTTPEITSVDFSVSPLLEEGSRVRPGTSLKIERLTVTDSTGARNPLPDDAEYAVEVVGGRYDRITGTALLSTDEAQAASGYAIVVSLTDQPDIRSVKRWTPDFALIKGPEPEDVTSFDVKLLWQAEDNQEYEITRGTELLPDQRYRLQVNVEDSLGRTFNTDYGERPVPSHRLAITDLKNLVLEDPEGLWLRPSDLLIGDTFELRVSYGQRHTKALEFTSDLEIRDGPPALTVANIEVVGELANESSLAPGVQKTLDVQVTDMKGRRWSLGRSTYSHLVKEYPLQKGRLEVTVDHGQYDATTRTVSFEPNPNVMLGEKYSIAVAYDGQQLISVQHEYTPDFLSIVPLMETDDLRYSGANGEVGSTGRNGRPGRDGRKSGQRATGGRGGRGGHATNGRNGRQAEQGPDLRVLALEVRTKDAADRLLLIELRRSGGQATYFVRLIDAAPLQIVTQGGTGGDGGDGGDGGRGGRGGDGFYSGDGGDGGDGGSGGDGGDGGDGGRIVVELIDSELERNFVLRSLGGRGGSGGRPGDGGEPGGPGSIEAYIDQSKGSQQPEAGSFGNEGNVGQVGQDGRNGRSGEASFSIEPRVSEMVHRAPDELKEVLLFY